MSSHVVRRRGTVRSEPLPATASGTTRPAGTRDEHLLLLEQRTEAAPDGPRTGARPARGRPADS
jgi:hypothetical protein